MITIKANRSLYTHYLEGEGIEIGALHGPLEILHQNAKIKYVDYKSTEDLKKHYSELNGIVNVDIISSADNLHGIQDNSLDFIVANHVIEHLANPIKALEVWHNKLKADGTLFLAFPDAKSCPDKVRRITSLSHYIQDYAVKDHAMPNDEHLLSFVYAWNPGYFVVLQEIKNVLDYMWANDLDYLDDYCEKLLSDKNQDCVHSLLSNRNIELHHHVFDYHSMKDLLMYVYKNLNFSLQLIDLSMTKYHLNECIFILRKTKVAHSPFMDESAKTAEAKERLLEDCFKEQAELIEKQRKILDERYEMIQDLTKMVAGKLSIRPKMIGNVIFQVMKEKTIRYLKSRDSAAFVVQKMRNLLNKR